MVLCVNHVKLPDVEMLLSSRYMSSLREFFFYLNSSSLSLSYFQMPLIGNKVQSMRLRALTTSQNCQTRPFVKRLSIRTVQQISLFLNITRGSDWFLAKIHEKS